MGHTHINIGLAATTTAMVLGLIEPGIIPIAATTIGSIIPDADTDKSSINRAGHIGKFGYILLGIGLLYYQQTVTTAIISAILIIIGFSKHRGITHSLLAIIALYFGAAALGQSVRIALLIGFSFHILADLFTDHGVQLFWPYPKKISLCDLTTNGAAEALISFAGAGVIFFNMYRMLNQVGLHRILGI